MHKLIRLLPILLPLALKLFRSRPGGRQAGPPAPRR